MNLNFRKLNEDFDYNLSLRLLFTLITVAIITMSFDVLATSSDTDYVGEGLCHIIIIFRGTTAKGIAVVGIIVLGIQTLRGKLQWEVALVIITAIIIIFKAPDIVNMVSGESTSNCVS